MTTYHMGLTPEMALEISNERIDDETLAELIDFRRSSLDYHIKQGHKNQSFMHGVVLSALRELLAYREASMEPVAPFGYVHQCDHFFTNDHGNIYKTPGGNFTRPLYSAPPLQAVTVPDGWLLIPTKPSQAHLNSIAMRYRHDFYLLNDAQKDSALATARQMYEECSGMGFFTIPDAEKCHK